MERFMNDLEIILKLAILIFVPILLVYPIFLVINKKRKDIKKLAIEHPELIESMELHEGEDLILLVKLKGKRMTAIAYYQEAKELHEKFKEVIKSKK